MWLKRILIGAGIVLALLTHFGPLGWLLDAERDG
jgi:hypothetical protein